jgi:hypothetical protein
MSQNNVLRRIGGDENSLYRAFTIIFPSFLSFSRHFTVRRAFTIIFPSFSLHFTEVELFLTNGFLVGMIHFTVILPSRHFTFRQFRPVPFHHTGAK